MKQDVNLKITNNLIMIEKGTEELLIANSFGIMPIYIRRGADYVKRLIRSVKVLVTEEKLTTSFPHDRQLIEKLMEHRIIIPRDAEEKGED